MRNGLETTYGRAKILGAIAYTLVSVLHKMFADHPAPIMTAAANLQKAKVQNHKWLTYRLSVYGCYNSQNIECLTDWQR